MDMDYTIGIKHSYRGHHYVLQNVLILRAVCEHTHKHTPTSFEVRHILTVVTLSTRSVN
jgi:hypothetical protein